MEAFNKRADSERIYMACLGSAITDNLVGRKYGYGILGSFYSRRDWESGVFETLMDQQDARASGGEDGQSGGQSSGLDAGPCEGPSGGPAGNGQEQGTADDMSAGPDPLRAVQQNVESGLVNSEPADVDVASDGGGGAVTSSGSAPGTSTTEAAVSSGVRVGSERQARLSHWLL